jgi:hypothetical protein
MEYDNTQCWKWREGGGPESFFEDPCIEEMPRNTRRTTQRRGGGYVTSQQFFNPDVYPPFSNQPDVSTAPTDTAVRPVLHSTFKVGGKRRKSSRKYRGGFSPSLMGPFIQNAQNAIVPLALYSAYHLMPKKSSNIVSLRRNKSLRSRK